MGKFRDNKSTIDRNIYSEKLRRFDTFIYFYFVGKWVELGPSAMALRGLLKQHCGRLC